LQKAGIHAFSAITFGKNRNFQYTSFQKNRKLFIEARIAIRRLKIAAWPNP